MEQSGGQRIHQNAARFKIDIRHGSQRERDHHRLLALFAQLQKVAATEIEHARDFAPELAVGIPGFQPFEIGMEIFALFQFLIIKAGAVDEQVEALERFRRECPAPRRLRR